MAEKREAEEKEAAGEPAPATVEKTPKKRLPLHLLSGGPGAWCILLATSYDAM
jgi:hypothetical protein